MTLILIIKTIIEITRTVSAFLIIKIFCKFENFQKKLFTNSVKSLINFVILY